MRRWSRRELHDNDVDLGLLLWSIERSAKADAFGPERSVVRLQLTDQPASKTFWWFVNEGGACQLCLHDPGFEVDLDLACTLPDMIYIIRGDLPLTRALASDRLEAFGARAIKDRLESWLNLSPLAPIPSERQGISGNAVA